MLNLAGQLCQWSSDGVELWRDHDHLHYRIPANDLSDAIQSDILAKRTSILELFSDRHNQVGPFPVPPNVRSMLTLEKLQPGHCGHILRYAMTLDFDIDVAKLQTAVDHTMGRHPMLNAAYHWLDNSPYLFFERKLRHL